jgi:TRAP-type C4-dicarboxylate transport system permease small subunit
LKTSGSGSDCEEPEVRREMKPATQLSVGAFITIVGLLLLAFGVDIAKRITRDHVAGFGVAIGVIGLALICFGVWRCGIRIKFPPKKGPPSN